MAVNGVGGVNGGNTTLQTGLQGVQNGVRKANEAAQEIAENGTTESLDAASLAEAIVELKEAEAQVEASVEVIETEDRLLGSILDIKA